VRQLRFGATYCRLLSDRLGLHRRHPRHREYRERCGRQALRALLGRGRGRGHGHDFDRDRESSHRDRAPQLRRRFCGLPPALATLRVRRSALLPAQRRLRFPSSAVSLSFLLPGALPVLVMARCGSLSSSPPLPP